MSDPQQDKLRELYRRSRQEQPSVDLDRQIRDAARRSVQRRSRRWIWGLSTAAVLMLSFTVVLDLYLGDRAQETPYFNDFQSSITPPQVERKAMGRERADEEIKQQYRAPAAPAAEPVIDFYEVLKSREMEIEPNSIAIVPAEKSKKEHSARVQRSWLSDMQAMDRPIVSVQIPQFPTTLAELLALGEDLSGGQTSSGLISLYSADKMILMLKPEAGYFRLRAWQGVDVIGVKVDWRLKAADLTDCQQQAVYTSCAMGQGITGYFEGERLDYIEWIQTHE